MSSRPAWSTESVPGQLHRETTNKNKKFLKPGAVAHAFNLSNWEAEPGGSMVQNEP